MWREQAGWKPSAAHQAWIAVVKSGGFGGVEQKTVFFERASASRCAVHINVIHLRKWISSTCTISGGKRMLILQDGQWVNQFFSPFGKILQSFFFFYSSSFTIVSKMMRFPSVSRAFRSMSTIERFFRPRHLSSNTLQEQEEKSNIERFVSR